MSFWGEGFRERAAVGGEEQYRVGRWKEVFHRERFE